MEATLSESIQESVQQAVKDAMASDERVQRAVSTSSEVLRLQNVLKVKDKELEDARKEMTALKTNLSTKDRALQQADQDLRILKERNVATDGEVANMAKELAMLKVDKRKLESQLASLVRKGDKESMLTAQEKAAVAAAGGTFEHGVLQGLPSCDHVAALQSDLRKARIEGEKAAESIKVLENMLRAKDRHINSLMRKVEEGEAQRIRCGQLENKLLEAAKQLDEQRTATRLTAEALKNRTAERSKLAGDLDRSKAALEAAAQQAARSSAVLKATEARCAALEHEVGVLVGQLARTSAVAHRVAVAEVKAGPHDEGTVPASRHAEEVRFMGGEIARLQQRISALEKELAVSDALKDQYRRRSELGAGNVSSTMNSGSLRSSADTSPTTTLDGTATALVKPSRPTSANTRPTSAPRRPSTAGATNTNNPTTSASATAGSRPRSAPRGKDASRTSVDAGGGNNGGAAATTGIGANNAVRASFSGSLRRRSLPWGNAALPTGGSAASSPRGGVALGGVVGGAGVAGGGGGILARAGVVGASGLRNSRQGLGSVNAAKGPTARRESATTSLKPVGVVEVATELKIVKEDVDPKALTVGSIQMSECAHLTSTEGAFCEVI